jgi:hypothetical protein
MLETVPRLADCNEAKLSNFNQCCFSAAQDRAARGVAQAFAKPSPISETPGPFRPNRTSRISISPDFRARNSEQMVSEFVARHVSPM